MKSSMADFLPNHRRTYSGLEKAAWAAKLLFLTIGIASTAILMGRLAFPYLQTLLPYSSFPKLWDSLVSWFAPPYLFITVHFIIMVIWKLHGNQRPEYVDDNSMNDDPSPLSQGLVHVTVETPAEISIENHPAEPEPDQPEIRILKASAADTADNEKSTERQRPWPPPEANPEVIKEMEEEMDYCLSSSPDSIDATWRAIMNRKSSPVKKQLKKSDTWEKTSHAQPKPPPSPKTLTRAVAVDSREFRKADTDRDHQDSSSAVGGVKKEMRKSKTFRESTGAATSNAGWRGRDVLVVGRDELSSKVEAFIKMNYDQMRLQRQEAQKQRYVGMVNAAY